MGGSALPARVLSWLDGFWDEAAGLLRYPSAVGEGANPYQQPGVPVVRETATYAAALLARDGSGDRGRADRALAAVLAHQVDEPRSVCHGTFRRSPREPVPGPSPREWIDYDPNWREFVGTAFALALEHEAKLPAARVAALDAALRRAVEGTLARDVPPAYTNIALMSAFLLDWAGDRLGEPAWRVRGEALGDALVRGYREAGAFPEHNSPTYYGTDLYGLALWRARAPSPRLRSWGAETEAALWRDLARFYHAGLRNLCGPWTRAYGMDMTRYVAGLGTWIAAAVPSEAAPLPPLGPAVPHAHDFCEVALVARLGARPPEDVLPHLRAFRGARRVAQRIAERPPRTATAWLGEHAMLGGEHTGGRHVHWQHHPATAHWRRPDGRIGWLRVVSAAPVDAVAEPGRLGVTVHTGQQWLRRAEVAVDVELCGAGETLPLRDGACWRIPGAVWRLGVEGAGAAVLSPVADVGHVRGGFRFPPGAAPPRLHLDLRVEPGA